MLFDEKSYYCFIDEEEFDAQVIFVHNHCYDKCKRKVIIYYKDNDQIIKEIKTIDNYFYNDDLSDREIITKYYIETFKLNNFKLTDRTYVRIFGLGSYFKYAKDEEEAMDEYKDEEELVKQKFLDYDKNYLKIDEKEFLQGGNVWKK